MPIDTSIYSSLLQPPKSVNDYNSQALQALLQQAQVANIPLQQQMQALQLKGAQLTNDKQQQMMNLLTPVLSRLTGGAQGGALGGAQGAPMSAGGPPMNALAQSGVAPGGGTNFPLSFGDVVAMKLAGLPDLTNDFKMSLEGVSHAPGSEVTDVQGRTRRIAQLATGQTQNPDGSVSNLPGAVAASSEAAGATKAAELRATNDATPVPLDRLGVDGKPLTMTMSDLLAQMRAKNAPPSPFSTPFEAQTPRLQNIVMNDARKDGAEQTATFNGQPLHPNVQALQNDLDAAKQQGPAGIGNFLSKYAPAMSALPDPASRAKAMQSLWLALQGPVGTPYNVADKMSPQDGGFLGFQRPADTAAEKATAEATAKANVESATAPGIEYGKGQAKEAVSYASNLSDRVSTGQDLMMRIDEARKALAQFKPGMGAEVRLNAARAAQALGLPDSLVSRINDGDVAAKQEFSKLSAQTAMETLKQAMAGAGRITQAEFKVFQQNNPNITLDPNAIEKIYAFQQKSYQRDFAEQQSRQQFIDSGGSPAAWRPTWAKTIDPAGTGNLSLPGNVAPAGGGGLNIDPAAVAAELKRRGH